MLSFIKKRQEIKDAYREVFDSNAGQLVLQHLAKNCFLYDPTYVPGDQTETAHREGMRRVVLSIVRQLEGPDDILAKMIKENFDEQQSVSAPTEY